MKKQGISVEHIPPAPPGKPSVWEFLPESASRDETWVRRLKKLPVASLNGRLVTVEVSLASGAQMPALMSNVDLDDTSLNEHFLSLSIFKNERWILLARYHDPDAVKHGPAAFARALGVSLKEVFPIEFNLTGVVCGKRKCLRGKIAKSPSKRLTRAERMRLVVDSL
jgi:hypothetical protein